MAAFQAAGWPSFIQYHLEDEKDAYVIEEPQRTLAGAIGGTTQELAFTIRNVSRRPIRVVGAEFS